MIIKMKEVSIRDLCAGYSDLSIHELGITGYSGRLDIRPKYQREFVYDDKKRNAVMETVWKGFPLNVMYWVRIGDDRYELQVGLPGLLHRVGLYEGHAHPTRLFRNRTKVDRRRQELDY